MHTSGFHLPKFLNLRRLKQPRHIILLPERAAEQLGVLETINIYLNNNILLINDI